MPSLDVRLARVEQRQGVDDERRARTARDAEALRTKILAMADAFSEEDRHLSEQALAKDSRATRLAWALRFAPRRVPQLIEELKEMIACRTAR